jgi:hypothetical protein
MTYSPEWNAMCRQATCKACKKTTWAGCGQHKAEVLRGVPKNERCTCTAADKAAAKKSGSFLSRLFG